MTLMIILVLLGIAVAVAGARLRYLFEYPRQVTALSRILAVLLIFLGLASTSYIKIGQNETGHLNKIYGAKSLPTGSIIATKGEKGPQAKVLRPGFHAKLFLNIMYKVEKRPILHVPGGQYALLTAKDGTALPPGQTFADQLPDQSYVLDAEKFLTQGGQKGPQTIVLPPGDYPLNAYLWETELDAMTEIPKGFVGIVKSNVHDKVPFGGLEAEKPKNCTPTDLKVEISTKIHPLVPVGCMGVWEKALGPNNYNLNKKAYTVTLLESRTQAWLYEGGYTSRHFDLSVSDDGKITQEPRSEEIPVPDGAAGKAIAVKVEGWTVFQGVRVLLEVDPEHAPYVVAVVGGLEEVEGRVVTSALEAELSNLAGGTIEAPTVVTDKDGRPVYKDGVVQIRKIRRPTHVLDFIENRELIESHIEPRLTAEAVKLGITIKEVRLLKPDFPPELLLARKREQLAQQLKLAYEQEQIAQKSRVMMEAERATADQQSQLVEAKIAFQRAEQIAQAAKQQGQGEKDRLTLIAQGQKLQSEVLGQDRVVELQKFEMILQRVFDLLGKNPKILEVALGSAHKFVPNTVITTGGQEQFTGGMAILGKLLQGSNNTTDSVK